MVCRFVGPGSPLHSTTRVLRHVSTTGRAGEGSNVTCRWVVRDDAQHVPLHVLDESTLCGEL